jgi:hypothetical protein
LLPQLFSVHTSAKPLLLSRKKLVSHDPISVESDAVVQTTVAPNALLATAEHGLQVPTDQVPAASSHATVP